MYGHLKPLLFVFTYKLRQAGVLLTKKYVVTTIDGRMILTRG